MRGEIAIHVQIKNGQLFDSDKEEIINLANVKEVIQKSAFNSGLIYVHLSLNGNERNITSIELVYRDDLGQLISKEWQSQSMDRQIRKQYPMELKYCRKF
jgi:hypothetical protein